MASAPQRAVGNGATALLLSGAIGVQAALSVLQADRTRRRILVMLVVTPQLRLPICDCGWDAGSS